MLQFSRRGFGNGGEKGESRMYLCWPCVHLLEATALDLSVQLLTFWVDAGARGVEEPTRGG